MSRQMRRVYPLLFVRSMPIGFTRTVGLLDGKPKKLNVERLDDGSFECTMESRQQLDVHVHDDILWTSKYPPLRLPFHQGAVVNDISFFREIDLWHKLEELPIRGRYRYYRENATLMVASPERCTTYSFRPVDNEKCQVLIRDRHFGGTEMLSVHPSEIMEEILEEQQNQFAFIKQNTYESFA
jgi:hypothetical protein